VQDFRFHCVKFSNVFDKARLFSQYNRMECLALLQLIQLIFHAEVS